MPTRTIAVVGGTGAEEGGVVNVLLAESGDTVRVLRRRRLVPLASPHQILRSLHR